MDLNFSLPLSDNEYKRAQQKAHYQGKSDLFQQLYGKRGLNNGRSKDRQFQNRKNLLRERANPEKRLYNAAKYRSSKNGLEFNISLSDIKIPDVCPVLGIPLVQGNEEFNNSPSLDRIDSTKGYIVGNIQVISQRANTIKRDATLEELKLLVKHLETLV